MLLHIYQIGYLCCLWLIGLSSKQQTVKKVLLVSNKIFHYRIPIYNFFYQEFKKHAIELSVIANEIQPESAESVRFPCSIVPFNIFKYCNFIDKTQPDAIIFFLHLKDKVLWPVLYYARIKHIPLIKWGHMLNTKDLHNKLKNKLFDHIHNMSDAIIAYSDDEKRHLQSKNLLKVFVAYNTINFNILPAIIPSKEDLRSKYNIPYKNVILFVARITQPKRLDILLEMFSLHSMPDIGLVIVGPGMPDTYQHIIDKNKNVKYLGAIYDHVQINEIYKMADLVCIPGSNGLGVNQAMYWGLPVVTIASEEHCPEITYVVNDRNGYCVNSKEELREKILYLCKNPSHLKQLSLHAAEDIRNNASIEKMFEGFLKAVNFATNRFA